MNKTSERLLAGGGLPSLVRGALFGALLLVSTMASANDAAYKLPGNLPSGCTGSGTSYTCTDLTLVWHDSIAVVNANTTLTVTGTLKVAGNEINMGDVWAGNNKTHTSSPVGGFTIKTNKFAGSDYVHLNGNLEVTGTGDMKVAWDTSISGTFMSAGNVKLAWSVGVVGSVVAKSIDFSGGGSLGSVTATAGGITTGSAKSGSEIKSLTATGDIVLGSKNHVLGDVVSSGGAVTLQATDSIVDGSIFASGNVTLANGSHVLGSVTSANGNVVTESSGVTIDKCVTAGSTKKITLGYATSAGGVCCNTGNACSNTCVVNDIGWQKPMPPLCSAVGGSTPAGDFTCLETGTGNTKDKIPRWDPAARKPLYTKLVDTSFAVDVAALKTGGTGLLESNYVNVTSGDKWVRVELFDASTAANCAAYANPLASQVVAFAYGKPSGEAGRTVTQPLTVGDAYKNVICRVRECTTSSCTKLTALSGCSSPEVFAVRPHALELTTNSASNATSSGKPVFKAGSDTFSLVATAKTYDLTTAVAPTKFIRTVAGYSGTPTTKADTTPMTAIDNKTSWVAGSVSPLAAATKGVSTSAPTYSEVGLFRLAGYAPSTAGYASGDDTTARGLYDNTWAAVDSAQGDCVVGSYSNRVNSAGMYGCNFGLVVNQTFGRFIPDHFSVAASSFVPGYKDVTEPQNSFSYMDQTFALSATLEARNASEVKTSNYMGEFAKGVVGVQMENANNGTAIDGSRLAGQGTPVWSSGAYSFVATKFTRLASGPDGAYDVLDIGLSVNDETALLSASRPYMKDRDMDASSSYDCTAKGDCSAAKIVTAAKVRFGRLKLSNYFGSDRADLEIPVEAQYWSGQTWVKNDKDFTKFAKSAVKLTGALSPDNAVRDDEIKLSHGDGKIVLKCPYATCPQNSKPANTLTGTVGVCVDLGTDPVSSPRVDCVAESPANLPYLQGKWLSGATYANDPTAYATFGIYSPEGKKTVHVRESF